VEIAMSQERTKGGAPKPRRAAPIQPDRPARGDEREAPAQDGAAPESADGGKLREQEKTAVENVRESYK
jgi:hypothetical protein